MSRTHRSQPLIDWLTAARGDEITVTLTEIATLIDSPLPPSAAIRPDYWGHTGNAIPRALRAHGWRAHMQPQGDAVTFSRAPSKMGSRPSSFDPLLALLDQQEGDCVRLTFEQLAELLGGYLVRRARVDPAWWDERERYARRWESRGWKARLDIRGRAVEFRRIS